MLKGHITSYDVLTKSCDGSTYIYFKDKTNQKFIDKVQILLKSLESLPVNSIERCLTSGQLHTIGTDSECTFMLEAKKGYYFVDDINGDFIESVNPKDIVTLPHHVYSAHSYLTSKPDYTTFFMASGPLIKSNYSQEEGQLINHALTLAYLLALTFKNIDGHMEWSLLNEVNQ